VWLVREGVSGGGWGAGVKTRVPRVPQRHLRYGTLSLYRTGRDTNPDKVILVLEDAWNIRYETSIHNRVSLPLRPPTPIEFLRKRHNKDETTLNR
jgi:hypothetical protein